MESQDQKGTHSHPVQSLRYTNRDTEAQGREVICTKSPWEKRLGEEQQGENMWRERAGMKKQNGNDVVCSLQLPKNGEVKSEPIKEKLVNCLPSSLTQEQLFE